VLKRILVFLYVLVAAIILGSALVGLDIISANAGLVVWLLGVIGAIIAFVKSKPKSN